MTEPDVLLKRGGVFTLIAAVALGAWGWSLGRQSRARTHDLSAAYQSAVGDAGRARQQLDTLGKRLDDVDRSLNQRLDRIDARLGKTSGRIRPSRFK